MADLNSDPSYLAYLRALGFQENQASTNAEQKIGQVQDQATFAQPVIEQQGALARQGISGNFEDRGLFRSGEHELALAHQRAGEQAQLGALNMGAGSDVAGIQAALAQQIADWQRQKAEQALTTSGNTYLSDLLRPFTGITG